VKPTPSLPEHTVLIERVKVKPSPGIDQPKVVHRSKLTALIFEPPDGTPGLRRCNFFPATHFFNRMRDGQLPPWGGEALRLSWRLRRV